MKKLFLFVLMTYLSVTSIAQYATPGTGVDWTFDDLVLQSNGVVTHDLDTFFVHQDLVISLRDQVLVTEPIVIKIAGEVLITVEGVFQVYPENQARITAMDTNNRFLGFRFDNTSLSVLRNVIIEYGGGIKLVDSNMEITDCIIRYFNKAYSTGAIDLFHSNPLIARNEIYRNAGPAVASGANAASSPDIRYNTIYENNTSNANTPQINLGTMNDDTIRIVGNSITGLYDEAGGIAVSTLFGGAINCIIDSNLIQNNRYGITCYGNNISSIIRNNDILNNNLETNPMMGGSGINFYGDETNVSQVYYNTITGNLWGITIQNAARPNMGDLSPDSYNPGMNEIHNNGNSGADYDLYNNTPNPIMAEQNWWGTDDLGMVENQIFHQPDDPSLGLVDYEPILEGGVAVNEVPGSSLGLIENVYPNPASASFQVDLKSKATVCVLNLNGKEIYHAESSTTGTHISCDSWDAGVYLIVVRNGLHSETQKILVR
jgi:hypothetical protein